MSVDWTAKRAALSDRWSGNGLDPMTAFEMYGAVQRDIRNFNGSITGYDRRNLLNLVSSLLDRAEQAEVRLIEQAAAPDGLSEYAEAVADLLNHEDLDGYEHTGRVAVDDLKRLDEVHRRIIDAYDPLAATPSHPATSEEKEAVSQIHEHDWASSHPGLMEYCQRCGAWRDGTEEATPDAAICDHDGVEDASECPRAGT